MSDVTAMLSESDAPLTLLCVDDEPNILNSLRRLLRPHGYRVLTAAGGAEGLEVIASTSVDLVLSDMRMPQMDGAQFLEQVKLRAPHAVRILLTGYADLSATIAAINDAGVDRYISKPWDDAVVVEVVKNALERKVLAAEKARLERLTVQQNLELMKLNATLESKVQARTGELAEALAALQEVHGKLKKTFMTSITVFSNLIELREGAIGGRSRRIAELAKRIALQMGLTKDEVQDVTLAGLLHGIGKFGLSEALLRRPLSTLAHEDRAAVMKHPGHGQTALLALEQLAGAGKLIRSYRERHDGMGYPEGLRGDSIPPGARILALAHDYEAAQEGGVTGFAMSKLKAYEHILEGRGTRYHPAVVSAFGATIEAAGATPVAERELTANELTVGMELTRDLVTADGILLLSREHTLDATLIAKLQRYEARDDNRSITVYVRAR
jgi:response regulator RpfG family c-di-GMP phosphodiesterase